MENNKIPSEDENKALENAKAFAEEAKYDIEAADKLLKNLDLNNCENDDRVFYLGRRSFFFLQQAVEKTSKVYAFLLCLKLSKIANSPYHNNLTKDKRSVFKKLFEQLSNPKRMSHLPHTTLLYVTSKLFLLTHESDFEKYLENEIKNKLKNKLNELFEGVKLSGEEIISIFDETASIASEKCYNDIFNNSEFKLSDEKVNEECKTIIENYEKSRKVKKRLVNFLKRDPPSMSEVENTNSIFSNIIKLNWRLSEDAQAPFNERKDQFRPQVMRRTYVKIIVNTPNGKKYKYNKAKLGEDEQKVLLRAFERDFPDFIHCVFCFNFVLPAYLILMSSYLAWYEDGGRYPNASYSQMDTKSVCSDIKIINNVKEGADSLLDIVYKSINWKERSFKEKLFTDIVPLALF
jgi:hypothetical protein